jgi:hypothetical protein
MKAAYTDPAMEGSDRPAPGPVPHPGLSAAGRTSENEGMNRVLVGILSAVLLSCSHGADTAVATRDSFIQVMVELRRAANQAAGDTAAFAARREQILLDAGVTEGQLHAYIEVHGRDVEHMARVWETINTRLSDLEEQPEPLEDADPPAGESGTEAVLPDGDAPQQNDSPPARRPAADPDDPGGRSDLLLWGSPLIGGVELARSESVSAAQDGR